MADPATILLGAGGNLLSSVGSALFGNSLGRQNEERLWKERYSPQAQVRNLAAAGINPAVVMGNQSPVLTAGGRMDIPDVSPFGIGTTALSEIGNYFKSLADAKKAGAEEKNVSVQTEKALTEIDAQKMQNEFTKKYGNQKWLLDLSTAYQNVLLAQKTNDIKEQEKAINEWKKVSEKAISEANEHQRDMLKKDLDNKDEEIRLSNNLLKEKAKTEKSSQSANYASANASNAAAKNSEAQAFINEQEGRMRKVLADNQTNPQVVRKQLETLFEDLKAKKMQSTLDAEKAFEEWRHINYENDYFMDKKYDARVDYFLSWLRKRVGAFPTP